jgi:hypothetical protein
MLGNPPGASPDREKFTFKVHCTFELQHAFARADVDDDGDSADPCFEPTDSALYALAEEVSSSLVCCSAKNVETFSDFNSFIEIDEDVYICGVFCSFEFEYAFDESRVVQIPCRGGRRVAPSELALAELCEELTRDVGYNDFIVDLEASAEPEDLISIERNGQLHFPPKKRKRRLQIR